MLGIADELGLPIKFIGVGEGEEDLLEFDPASFAEAAALMNNADGPRLHGDGLRPGGKGPGPDEPEPVRRRGHRPARTRSSARDFTRKPASRTPRSIALAGPGRRSKGATIYLTLEPCVHWGRTPPCVDEPHRSRPPRAVISAIDPNPLVDSGAASRPWRKAGFELATGLLEARNRRLNESYLKYITRKDRRS